MIFSKITNTKIKAKKINQRLWRIVIISRLNFPNIRILLSSDWANALKILIRSSLFAPSLCKLRIETELKRVGSITKEKVCSAVALDAGLTARILQILQTLTGNFFSGFSNSLIFLTNRGSVLSAYPSVKL